MEVQLIECKKIEWPKNEKDTRTFSSEFAISLANSIKVEGLLSPIMVRPNPAKSGHYLGVAGRHRAYAVGKVLKQSHIAARVVQGMDDADAEMAMLADNLWRHPLSRLQHTMSLKKWFAHYQSKAPAKAVQVVNKAVQVVNVDSGTNKSARASKSSFIRMVAEATGQSESSVARSYRIAQVFDERQLEVFSRTGVSQSTMIAIARIKGESKRDEVVNLISVGIEPADAIKEVMGATGPVRGDGSGRAAAKKNAPELSAIEAIETSSDRDLLIGIEGLAFMLIRSVSSIQRDDEAGRIPAPMELGGSKLWRLSEARAWLRAGCPDRSTWESRFKK